MPKVKIVPYEPEKHKLILKEISKSDHPLIERFDDTPGTVNLVCLNEKDEVIGHAHLVTTIYIKHMNIDQSIPWRERVQYFWAMVSTIAESLEIKGYKFWFLFKKKGHNIVCPKIYSVVAKKITHKQYNVFANFGEE